MGILSAIASALAPSSHRTGCATCPDLLPDADPEFSAAVTALGAKLAGADGRDNAREYQAFTEVFAPEPEAERSVRRFYDLARGTTLGFESYARRIGDRYRACPNLLERVVDGLFHVAEADGAVTWRELDFLERVSDLFGLSPLSFRRIKGEHLGVPADDPYAVLGVAADAPDETVRAAWRSAIVDAHPDRAAARGLSGDLLAAAVEQASALNAAFDAVMRERRPPDALQPA